MKTIIFSAIFFCTIAMPTLAELTPQDLDKIRLIVKEEIEEEIKPIKAEVVAVKAEVESLKIDVSWIRGRLEGIDEQFEGVNKQIAHVTYVTYGLIALIVAAIGIPQIIMAWRSGKDREQERINQELRQEIEALKQQRIISP